MASGQQLQCTMVPSSATSAGDWNRSRFARKWPCFFIDRINSGKLRRHDPPPIAFRINWRRNRRGSLPQVERVAAVGETVQRQEKLFGDRHLQAGPKWFFDHVEDCPDEIGIHRRSPAAQSDPSAERAEVQIRRTGDRGSSRSLDRRAAAKAKPRGASLAFRGPGRLRSALSPARRGRGSRAGNRGAARSARIEPPR